MSIVSFREFCEEFRVKKGDDESLGIFKNPTADEIKKLPKDVRGIVTKTGDVYIGNIGHQMAGFHSEIHKRTAKIYRDRIGDAVGFFSSGDYKKGVTIQRVGNTRTFVLGETTPRTDLSLRYPLSNALGEQMLKKIKLYIQKARKKNPGLKFVMKNIMELGE